VLFINPISSLGVVLFISFAKEIIWDGWFRRGTVEAKDALATFLGGLIPFLGHIF
jgi:hypothetical protein